MSLGVLDEYRELRSELRLMLDRREKVRSFAYTVALGVLGLGLSDHVSIEYRPYLLVVGSFCVLSLWYDEIRRMRAIFRIATYIEVYTESVVDAMHWESWGAKHRIQGSRIGRVFANGDVGILGCVLAGLGVWMFFGVERILALTIAGLFVLLAAAIGTAALRMFPGAREVERANWARVRASLENGSE